MKKMKRQLKIFMGRKKIYPTNSQQDPVIAARAL
jgi:hypothetical protein